MKEENVIKFFKEQQEIVKGSYYPPNELYEILFKMIDELHQYRSIGTVEECQEAVGRI